jgi:hypothetical protein
MKPLPLIKLLTLALALAALGPTAARAQDPSHADHIMVVPADFKWADAKSLPPGAKVAVIEGPANEAVPFILRIKFPADYQGNQQVLVVPEANAGWVLVPFFGAVLLFSARQLFRAKGTE